MSRVQSRVTNQALELAGIQRGDQGPRISDNIEMTYSMGDLSFLLAPIPGADGFTLAGAAGVALLFSGVELHAPPESGIQITHVENLEASACGFLIAAGASLDDNLTTVTPTTASPVGSTRAFIQTGTSAVSPATIEIPASASLPQATLPIKIFPGEHFLFIQKTANTLMRVNLFWREVPIVSATL